MTDKIANFKHRTNEDTSMLHERKGRFFNRNGRWFFKTRDETDYGPYESRVECRYAYNEFMDIVSESNLLAAESYEFQQWQAPKINFS